MARVLSKDYPSWIHAFRDWTVPRSEAPESYILFTGLFTLAAALKRKVCFPPEMMGSYEIYPNLYVILIGPPGGPKKTTTINYARDLLREVEHITFSSTGGSTSKLVEMMSDTVDGNIVITSSEFGSFVGVSEEDMYDFLTDVFDNPRKYEYATRMHGVEEIQTPTINMLAGTTTEWVSQQMPAYALGGGFAGRCIFLYEEAPRRRRLYYDDVDYRVVEKLREGLIHDLVHISQLEGTFRHESKALKLKMESWYQQYSSRPVDDERLSSYQNRKHLHVHKLSMLLSLAESDDLVITETHFEAAKQVLEGIETKMPRVFSSVGKNPYSADLERIRDYIFSRGDTGTSFEHLLSRFYHDVDVESLHGIVNALEAMDYIRKEKNPEGRKRGVYYFPSL